MVPAPSWSGRRVLVTGAAGFIGSHLVELLLERGAHVTAMIRYTSHGARGALAHLPPERRDALAVVAGNVEDGNFVDEVVAGHDVVFHLAALIAIPYSYAAPLSYVRTNVEGTLNVLEAARQHGCRIVHTSTSEVYGTARRVPMDEGHPLQAQSPYAASKVAADKLAESYHCAYGLPVATLRPFNTYGPRQSARAIVPTIVSQALACPEIRLGSLHPVRDLTYVRDTAEAFVRVAERDAAIGRAIHIGAGKGTTIGDLARRILALMGVDKPIVGDPERIRPAASEVDRLVCDARTAHEVLGWQPSVALDEGLSRTIEFVRRHADAYDPGQYAR